jgi:short-subunit dehydrogenase
MAAGRAAQGFKERYGPWAVVAGASEGTGRAFARALAAEGLSCVLIANGGPLNELAEELRGEFGVDCVAAPIDLAGPDAFADIVAAVGDREVGLYVANAGADKFGDRFHDRPVSDSMDLVRINVVSQVHGCHHFGGLMRRRGRGGLLLVNSGACYGGGSFLAIYTAVKAFQLNFAESLWAELRPHGVDVLTLVLGKTDTPAYHRLQAKKGMPSGTGLASPDEVAAAGLARLPFGPVHNFGQADEAAGQLPGSAAARRVRVVALDAAIEQVFGKQPGPDLAGQDGAPARPRREVAE